MESIKLVPPNQKEIKVLDKINKLIYSGHMERRKTYRIMSERILCLFLGKQVEKHVGKCEICQKSPAVNLRS